MELEVFDEPNSKEQNIYNVVINRIYTDNCEPIIEVVIFKGDPLSETSVKCNYYAKEEVIIKIKNK